MRTPYTVAVRGATQLVHDSPAEMESKVIELVEQILHVNHLEISSVISIIFSQTADIVTSNPARALRSQHRFNTLPLFCAQEPRYPDSVPRIVRLLMHARALSSAAPIAQYLHGAQTLRPDLL